MAATTSQTATIASALQEQVHLRPYRNTQKPENMHVCLGQNMLYLCFSPAARTESVAVEGITMASQSSGDACRVHS